jgi:hypothetical protein
MQLDDGGDLVAPWQYWFTGTFADEYSLPAARRAAQRYVERSGAALAFWGTESGTVTGRNHLHGLLHYDSSVPSARSLWRLWHRAYGRAHVDQFDQEKGAAHYVSKYVARQLADYDLQGSSLVCPGLS